MPDEGRYLIAYHRFGTSLEDYPEGKGWRRETCIAPLMCIAPLIFDADGFMVPVVVN